MALTKVTYSMIAGEISNVLDYGAVGNGSTNDASALQAALDTGNNVLIPAGYTFATNTALQLKANKQVVFIEGTLKATAAITAVITSTDFNDVKVVGTGVIDANSLADNGVKFIATTIDPYGVVCEGFTVKNTAGPVAAAKGGVYIVSSGGKASTFRHKNVSVKNITARNCGDLGVLIAYCDIVTVDSCVFDTCAFHGHESVNCTDVLINGNTAIDCAVSGVGVGDECANWVISNNVIRNCAGDGSITCEFNSIFGTIVGNTIIDCNTQGINISFGAYGPGPFVKVQGIVCTNNFMRQKSGILNKIGINFYSSTSVGVADGVIISNNVIDGFNWGIAYQYADNGSIVGNTIMNLVGTLSKVIVVQMAAYVTVSNNTCKSNSGDHPIQLLSYAGTDCTFCNINNNFMAGAGSGTKSVVYVEGTGSHNISNNATGGALHYIDTAAASAIYAFGNTGNISGSSFAGSGAFRSISSFIADIQSLTGDGAVSTDTVNTVLSSNLNPNNITLADGESGQIKNIVYVAQTAGTDTVILTPTNFGNGTIITFNTVGESCQLMFVATDWWVVSINGAVVT